MGQSHSLFVVNEGPDGSGKETQTQLLGGYLEQQGFAVRRLAFPTYGLDPVADLIRSMLHNMKEDWNTRDWRSKAVLYASNRLRFLPELQRALENPRNVVVCDRFVGSNEAHMAALSSDPEERRERYLWIEHLEYEMMGLPRPVIVLLHTMPSAMRAELLNKREKGQPDAHEENNNYLDRVTECFLELKDMYPDVWRHIPADVDGVVQSPEQVSERVRKELQEHPAWAAFVSPALARV